MVLRRKDGMFGDEMSVSHVKVWCKCCRGDDNDGVALPVGRWSGLTTTSR